MKLTVCTDTHMFSKKVESKFETLIEEYNKEKFTLIGMPLEKLPLNCDGLPLILQKIYDYIFEYGLYDNCLFDEAYFNNGRKENIINAYELMTGPGQNCSSTINVDAVDVATVLVLWLYYLPEALISSKQFSMICDKNVNKNYQEIMNSMNIITRQTLRQVMNIVNSYEKEHKSYKDKIRNLFTMLLTKHLDVTSQKNGLQFIENLKIVLMKADKDNDEFMLKNKYSVIKENINQDENIFFKHNLCNKKNWLQSLSDDGLQHSANKDDTILEYNVLMKSSSCNLVCLIPKEDNLNDKLFSNSFTPNKDNLNSCSTDIFPVKHSQDSSVCVIDELIYSSQIDDIRNVERTMPTHSGSTMKRNKNKFINSHVERVLKLGFLSNEDSMLLQNTLKLMKILSKIKSIQHQIKIQRRNREDELGYTNEDSDFPDLHFLNNQLEYLVNQKNNYQIKTGLSYGRSYNRIVQNLKNVQKQAYKLHEEEKNSTKNQNKNMDKLLSDIYNIQIVLDYLENNCGSKELPWRSSKGCPGYKKKTNKQLNCVTVVSDLQTIGEHEVMETISQLENTK